MSETRRNLWVGSFVLFGLTAFGILIVLFGKVPTWITRGNTYELAIHFEFVSGIREGTLVTLGGKTIGRVKSVEFRDRDHIDQGITVVATIENDYRLPKDCRAQTSEAILGMGRPSIRIVVDARTDEYLPLGQIVQGHTTPAVETIFPAAVVDTLQTTATRMGEAAAALTPVLHDLHEVLVKRDVSEVDGPAGRPGNLSSAMSRFDSMLKHFNEVLGDPTVKSQLRDGIANLHEMSEDMKTAVATFNEFAKDARLVAADARTLTGKFSNTLDNLDSNVQRVARALIADLDKAGEILDGFAVAALHIKRGEGSLGKFIQDDRLFESMVLTFERLNETLAEFKKLAEEWRSGKSKIRVGL